MNIEYKITFQDDLDAEETRNQYSFSRPWFRWVAIRGVAIFIVVDALTSIIWGILDKTDPYAIWLILFGFISLPLGIAYLFIMQPKIAQSSLKRRAKQKEWDKKPNQQEQKNPMLWLNW